MDDDSDLQAERAAAHDTTDLAARVRKCGSLTEDIAGLRRALEDKRRFLLKTQVLYFKNLQIQITVSQLGA